MIRYRYILTMHKRLLCCALLFALLTGLTSPLYAQPQGGDRPTFSKSHGIYKKSFSLFLFPSVSGRKMYYTLDGSWPTLQSQQYQKQLTITKTTIVRVAEQIEGDSLSPVSTASYIFPADVILQGNDKNGKPITPEGYPSEWGPFVDIKGTAPGYYAMDSEIVNESKSQVLQGLEELPIVSIATDIDHLFSHEKDEEKGGIYIYTGAPIGSQIGRDWERPISLEMMGGPLQHNFTVDCGIKIHGGHSRLPEKTPKHAFRLMFKSKYGPSKLNYPVFGEEGVGRYEDLILRTYFGNSWEHWDEGNRTKAQYTRDLWARSVQERLDEPNSKGQPVHVFLNGLYWGMYNLCERINKEHCAEHFGGKKGDWDVIKVEETAGEKVVASDGNLDAWQNMLDVVEQVKATSNVAFYKLQGLDYKGNPSDELEPLLDLENFCDYMLINIYGGNTDWDHHNWYAIRNRENPGRGFQFICWDTELIFGSANENVTNKDNAGKPSHMLNCLMRNSKFKQLFSHRAHVLLTEGGLLTEDGVREVWDSLYLNIQNALYDESARWGDYRRDIHPYTAKGHRYRVDTYYQNERNRLLTQYFPKRTDTVLDQLQSMGWYFTRDEITAPMADDMAGSIYDLQGRHCGMLDEEGRFPDHLPQGIYVINGRKVIRR